MQTSLAEAYQRKSIYTISRSCGFDVIDAQESAVDPRHFPVNDPRLLPAPEALRRGDRVVLLPKTHAITRMPLRDETIASSTLDSPNGHQPRQCDTMRCGEPTQAPPTQEMNVQKFGELSGQHIPADKFPRTPNTLVEPHSEGGATFGVKLLNGNDELDSDQLLQLSAVYKDAGTAISAYA